MNLLHVGNYVVHTKASQPLMGTLHEAVHQPTQQRCLIQLIDKRDAKDAAGLAREVRAQLAAKDLLTFPFSPSPSALFKPTTTAATAATATNTTAAAAAAAAQFPPLLRLREVLQDQEQPPSSPPPSSLKRKLEEVEGSPSTAPGSPAAAAAAAAPSSARYYLVFEGFREEVCDLLEFLKARGRTPEREAKVLFRQLLEAVHALHSAGIVHGDLKLPNVLVIRDPKDGALSIRIRDFRFSTILPKGSAPASASPSASQGEHLITTHKGSPAYLAPEVTYLNRAYCGKKAESYSLGVLLYTILVGAYPITASSLPELFELIRTRPVAVPSFVSREASDLITALLEKDPASRPSLAQALAHPWLASPALPASTPSSLLSCSRASASCPPSPQSGEEEQVVPGSSAPSASPAATNTPAASRTVHLRVSAHQQRNLALPSAC